MLWALGMMQGILSTALQLRLLLGFKGDAFAAPEGDKSDRRHSIIAQQGLGQHLPQTEPALTAAPSSKCPGMQKKQTHRA